MSEEIDAIIWKTIRDADLSQYSPLVIEILIHPGRAVIKLLDTNRIGKNSTKPYESKAIRDRDYSVAAVGIEISPEADIVITRDYRSKDKFDLTNPLSFQKASKAITTILDETLLEKADEAEAIVKSTPKRIFEMNISQTKLATSLGESTDGGGG